MEMIKDNLHEGHYMVEGNYVIARKDDHSIFTKSLWLSSIDSIDNYEVIDEPVEKEVEDGILQRTQESN